MRDAFGGSFMLMIFLVFIFIYISFTAVALSYAKAFKTKNAVISYLEESEITSLDGMTASQMNDFENFINQEIVGNKNYNMSDYNICRGYPETNDAGRITAICADAGIVISESKKDDRTEGFYYTVSTYLGWDIGFISKLTALSGDRSEQEPGNVTGTWKISGQTRLMVNK